MRTLSLAIALAAIAAASSAPAQPTPIDPKFRARIDRVLKATPLIDGHNDIAEQLKENYHGHVERLSSGTATWTPKPLMTDMARLHAGKVGGQFWSVYIDAAVTGDRAIRETLEQIDIVERMIAAYPNDLSKARTADDIVRAHKSGKVASLIGVEGGHQMGHSFAALRSYYDLGARYMTLTHFKTTEWANSATDAPRHGGLSPYGERVVHEMNRIGMLVDLSHVSEDTMLDALKMSTAPVIFSHSNARALQDHPRNVPDSVLRQLSSNGGVVMVNFFTGYLSEPLRQWNAERAAEHARRESLLIGNPDAVKAAMEAWDKANARPDADLGAVADHIEHIVKVAGVDHVGLGGDLDGVPFTPVGLDSVDGYPLLFAELIRRGWSDRDLAKLAGGNVLRAMRGAEARARAMKDVAPELDDYPPVTGE